MVLLSFKEFVDVIVMTFILSYIFSDILPSTKRGSFDAFWTSALAVAPGIILHEFAHKIVALLFGFGAVFSASYPFLLVGVLLKFVGSSFIFFVPGYVSFTCPGGCTSGLPTALIAFAGPAMNGILYLLARWYEPHMKTRRGLILIRATRRLNGFLFIFNMIPFPLFDGWKVYTGLWTWMMGI